MLLQYTDKAQREINLTNWDFTPRGGVFTNTILHQLMGKSFLDKDSFYARKDYFIIWGLRFQQKSPENPEATKHFVAGKKKKNKPNVTAL